MQREIKNYREEILKLLTIMLGVIISFCVLIFTFGLLIGMLLGIFNDCNIKNENFGYRIGCYISNNDYEAQKYYWYDGEKYKTEKEKNQAIKEVKYKNCVSTFGKVINEKYNNPDYIQNSQDNFSEVFKTINKNCNELIDTTPELLNNTN